MICVIRRLALTVSDVCLKLSCFQSTSTCSTLEVSHFIRYINFPTYLLTYLLATITATTAIFLTLSLLLQERPDLLDDVPQASVSLECQHAVFGGDFVKPGFLLVTKERVRGPDLIPAVVRQTYLGLVSKLSPAELQTLIGPLLSEVHADRIVLQTP